MVSQKSSARIDHTEFFQLLKNLTDGYARLQSGLKELHLRKLIDRKKWKNEVVPADLVFFQTIRKLWILLESGNTAIEFSTEMIREDELAKKWNVSRKTLYRRRKNRELPYIKDRHSEIWYSIPDVAHYLEKNKIADDLKKLAKNDTIFIFSAGLASKVFIYELYNYNKNATYMDIGSSLDYFYRKSRDFHHRPDYDGIFRKNVNKVLNETSKPYLETLKTPQIALICETLVPFFLLPR